MYAFEFAFSGLPPIDLHILFLISLRYVVYPLLYLWFYCHIHLVLSHPLLVHNTQADGAIIYLHIYKMELQIIPCHCLCDNMKSESIKGLDDGKCISATSFLLCNLESKNLYIMHPLSATLIIIHNQMEHYKNYIVIIRR